MLSEIGLETGRSEYRGASPKALSSFGLSAQTMNSGGDTDAIPNEKARSKGGQSGQGGTLTSGAQAVTGLYPAGKRLLKPERNLHMAHEPPGGKVVS